MGFWALDIRAPDAAECARMAGTLGYSGACIVAEKGRLGEARSAANAFASAEPGLDACAGVLLSGKAAGIRRDAKSLRRKAEIIVARGGSDELNREILEIPEIDILSGHLTGDGCGINHVLARIAAKNGVAIEFDFRPLLEAYRRHRAGIVSGLLETAGFVRKHGPPFVLTCAAQGPWEMRSPSELVAFGKFLGFSEPQCRRALSGERVMENRKRLAGKWVMPGVEME
jgi:ribonuclease P/MRP protein subunit RPP1